MAKVRYDRKISKDTALKFMTDGILLRELQEDFLLAKYSSIIIDEAHERSLNTDLLLGTPFCFVSMSSPCPNVTLLQPCMERQHLGISLGHPLQLDGL